MDILLNILVLLKELMVSRVIFIAILMAALVTLLNYILIMYRRHRKMTTEIKSLRETIQKLRLEKIQELESKSEIQATIKNELEVLKGLENRGEFDLAEQKRKELEKNYGNKIEFLFQYSNYLLALNEFNKAEKFLLSKENTFKGQAPYYRQLGFFYNEIGKVHKAIEGLEKAIELEKDPRSYINISYSYWRLNDLNKAIDFAVKALECDPDEKTETNIKTNLAYYYAQAEILSKKEIAIQYASFAKDNYEKYKNANFLSNYGYVKMKFAQNLAEINAAIKYLIDIQGERDIKEEIEEYLDEAYKKSAILRKS